MVWDSASTLFVAKAPTGWHGYWGIDDVIQHLHDMYQTPFRIDPIYSEEKVVFIAGDIAETYAPVKITVAYGGQNPVPRLCIMVSYSRGRADSSGSLARGMFAKGLSRNRRELPIPRLLQRTARTFRMGPRASAAPPLHQRPSLARRRRSPASKPWAIIQACLAWSALSAA